MSAHILETQNGIGGNQKSARGSEHSGSGDQSGPSEGEPWGDRTKLKYDLPTEAHGVHGKSQPPATSSRADFTRTITGFGGPGQPVRGPSVSEMSDIQDTNKRRSILRHWLIHGFNMGYPGVTFLGCHADDETELGSCRGSKLHPCA
jgi:hypothetical protein